MNQMHSLMAAYGKVKNRDANLDTAVRDAVEKIFEGVDPENYRETADTAIRAADRMISETSDKKTRDFLQRSKKSIQQRVMVKVPAVQHDQPGKIQETTQQMADRLLREVLS